MKVDLRPRHRNRGRPPEKDARGFLEWLRKTKNCVFADDGTCEGDIEVMHLDFAGKMEGVDPRLGKGTATKVADRYSVPGCRSHAERQSHGWDTFIAEMKTSREAMMKAAAILWHRWPGRINHERKLEQSR